MKKNYTQNIKGRMRIALFLVLLGIGGTSKAQLTGIKNIPGAYPNLAAAIADLNTQGVGVGGVTINIVAGNPQTAPAGGYVIGNTGSMVLTTTTAAKPVLIQGNGNTITTSASLAAGDLNDAIIKLIGADWITISGFTMQENVANTTTAAATNNMTEFGVALFYVTATDGAQNNTIQNNTISLDRTYTNSFGIYSNVRHDAVNVLTAADITAITGANSNNKVYGNTIGNVNMGMAFIGSATATNQDNANDIGGTATGTGNTISNWGGAAAASSFVSNSATSYGIYMNHQTNYNIGYNTLTSATVTPAVTFRGIVQEYATTAPTGTIVNTITNNTVTMTSAATSGTFIGINTVSGNTTTTLNITNNSILNCAITGVASSSALSGIINSGAIHTLNITGNVYRGNNTSATSGAINAFANSGAVVNTININQNNVGDNTAGAITFSAANSGAHLFISNTAGSAATALSISNNNLQGIVYSVNATGAHTYINSTVHTGNTTINGNTFTNLVDNTTTSVTFIANNITRAANTVHNVNNNSIVTAFSKPVGGGTVLFYNSFSTSTAANNITEINTGNNFSNMTFTGATTITGWRCGDGSTTAPFGPAKTVTNNTFSNIVCGTSSAQILQVDYSNTAMVNNVSGNAITNITAGGALTGLISVTGSQNFFNNTIGGLSSTGATAVTGLQISNGATQNIFRNKIYNLESNNAGGSTFGITIAGATVGVTCNVYNNLIGDLRAISASGANVIRGINMTSTAATGSLNLYYNTIYINASSTGVDFGTSGIFHTASATATTAKLDMRNNIVLNSSTAAGTGLTVAYRRSAGTAGMLSNYDAVSNNNLFYAGTPSATNLIYADGTAAEQTLAGYKAGVYTAGTIAPRDAASVTGNLTFLSTSGNSPNFLHIDPTVATPVEGTGTSIAGVTDDYDGNLRNATTPDIGADELTGIPLAVTLVSFNAKEDNCLAVLNWQVADVNDVSRFVVLQSADGKLFTPISELVPITDVVTYGFKAEQPERNMYYQLKIEQHDGSELYSSVLSVTVSCDSKNISVFPNPVQDEVTITGLLTGHHIRITDVNGRIVYNGATVSGNTERINIGSLAGGIYNLSIFTEGGVLTKTLTLMKQ